MSDELKFAFGLWIFILLFLGLFGMAGYLEEKHQETMTRIKCESIKKENS